MLRLRLTMRCGTIRRMRRFRRLVPFRLGGVRHTFAQASFLTASSLKTSILTGEDVLLLPEGLVREPA